MSQTFASRAAVTAALLLSASASAFAQTAPATHSATPPAPVSLPAEGQAAPQPPFDMAVLEALNALSLETTRAFPWRANLVRTLDDFGSFRYAPESIEKFRKVFGTDQPLAIKRTASSSTRLSYLMTLQPVEYTLADGGSFAWAPLSGTIHTDPAGKRYSFQAAWPFMQVAFKDATVRLSDMSASGKMRRGIEGLWFGAMRFDLKSVTVNDPAAFAMDDTSGSFNVTERGKLVDIQYAVGTKSIEVGAESGFFDMAGRFVGLPARALAALLDAQARLEEITDPAEQARQTLAEFKKLAPSFAASGGALHIDLLRMTYKGHSATLKGQLAMRPLKGVAGATQADILRHLSGKFTLRIPVALVTEMARGIAREQLEKQKPGEPVDEAALAKMTGNVKDAMVGKFLGSGFAKLEKDELVTTILLSNGKLTANGKAIDIPSPSNPGRKAPQEQAPPPRELAKAGRDGK